MSRFVSSCGGLLVVMAASVAFGSVGCSGEDGSAPAASGNALTRVIPEAAGPNCAAGGQAVQYGVDMDANDVLDGDEVKGSSYVCNGTSPAPVAPTLEPIPVGDPRCPNGGTLIKLAGGSNAADSIICNGATGAQGPQGEQGIQGIQGEAGAQGDAGAPAPEPVLGQFMPSQIVKGAVVSCASVGTQATTATCTGMKVNGVDARLAPVEANVICGAITGKGYVTANGLGSTSSFVSWSSSSWTLGTGTTAPMQNLTCQR